MNKTPITIAFGDGIGPEIMRATLAILNAAQARIEPEIIEIGQKVYLEGYTSGIPDSAWVTLKRNQVLLKSPITTPQGSGYKSLNVTLRKAMDLYANVRPCVSYPPFVPTKFPQIDLVIVRENEEDLYAGIEHRQSEDVYQCLKIVTRQGCERIIRYAFEYALKYNRKKVTCLSKDNIMKMTDGLFHKVFNEIAVEYPSIANNHLIIDIGTALIATQPEYFDVIVTMNLYGDIISDVAAQVAGSVGLAGSANIGNQMAMFEAIHGSAPDIAGQDIANPSGLLNAAVQMLIHIGQPDIASLIENAWLKTIEDGIHTADIYSTTSSKAKVGTQAFAEAVIDRLGQNPQILKQVNFQAEPHSKIKWYVEKPKVKIKKELIGVDIFIDNANNLTPEEIAEKLSTITSPLKLIVIISKGLKIWPQDGFSISDVKHCCCRFQSAEDIADFKNITHADIQQLLSIFADRELDVVKTENLYLFNGELGFTLAQGQ